MKALDSVCKKLGCFFHSDRKSLKVLRSGVTCSAFVFKNVLLRTVDWIDDVKKQRERIQLRDCRAKAGKNGWKPELRQSNGGQEKRTELRSLEQSWEGGQERLESALKIWLGQQDERQCHSPTQDVEGAFQGRGIRERNFIWRYFE